MKHIMRKNFLSCPSTSLALQVQLVVLVSAFVMVSIGGDAIEARVPHQILGPGGMLWGRGARPHSACLLRIWPPVLS